MIDIYAAANLATSVIEAYFTYALFERFLKRRQALPRLVYAIVILVLAAGNYISYRVFPNQIVHVTAVILMGFAAAFFYKGKIQTRFMTAVLGFMISIMAETLVLMVLTIVSGENAEIIIGNTVFRLVGIAASKLLGFVFLRYVLHEVNKYKGSGDGDYLALFTVTFINITLILYTFSTTLGYCTNTYVRNLIAFCTFTMTAAAFAVLKLYEKMINQKISIDNQQLAQKRLNARIKHYKAMVRSQQQLRDVKHDLKNHLLSIDAKLENKEYEQCREYINALLDKTENTAIGINTGNTVLDAILNAKEAEAKKYGIDFTLKHKIPGGLEVAEEDICAVFGNALDNAIEACQKAQGKPYINISVAYIKGKLFIKIENSCAKGLDISLPTTKEDITNHGIGTMSMEAAIEKYNGTSSAELVGDRYILSIILETQK